MPRHEDKDKPAGQTVADLGEDALVEQLCALLPTGPAGGDLLVGPGDDCAVVRAPRGGRWLLKTDCVVEGVHYETASPPGGVGHKALARALSDIAAMGGRPRHALVTLVLPPARSANYARALYRGLAATARRHGVTVAGGETARPGAGGPAMISITLLGEAPPGAPITRAGGRPGHRLFVTGKLGGSFRSGRHLRFEPRLAAGAWLARECRPTAMMDLSDGLAADLPRLARASGCGWRLDIAALPRHRGCDAEAALTDGEDYELLFALPPKRAAALPERWARALPDLRVTEVGALAAPGTTTPPLTGGWAHF